MIEIVLRWADAPAKSDKFKTADAAARWIAKMIEKHGTPISVSTQDDFLRDQPEPPEIRP